MHILDIDAASRQRGLRLPAWAGATPYGSGQAASVVPLVCCASPKPVAASQRL